MTDAEIRCPECSASAWVERGELREMRERLRVLTEAARAATDAFFGDGQFARARDAMAALRGVLDDHPREPRDGFLDLIDGPLAGERRSVSGIGSHVAFSRAGIQYQYHADGTFDRVNGEFGGSV